ncbi:hypothetical protein P4S70_16715 [Enterovibrio sp. Hal110]
MYEAVANKKFQEQQNKFSKGIATRIDRITALWVAIQSAADTHFTELEDLILEAHKLAGTATTLGFVDLGSEGETLRS